MKMLFFLLVSLTFATPALAGTPEALLMSGNDQDLLALIRITAVTDAAIEATPEFVFPVSKVDPDELIVISRASDYLDEDMTYAAYDNLLEPGHVYLASLNQDGDQYVGKWGLYEVSSADYTEAQFLTIDNDIFAMLQWYMNTGGEPGGKFYSIGETTYITLDDGTRYEIFPDKTNLARASGIVIVEEASTVPISAMMAGFVVVAGAVTLGYFLGTRKQA